MGIYLNPGNDLFQMAINSQIYVDKSAMISCTNRLIGSEQRYLCVSRPRRFGKSMAANMLAAYYSKECVSASLFSSLKIAKAPDYQAHLNRYNVISINMQNFLSLTSDVNEALQYLQKRIIKELQLSFPNVIDPEETFLSMALEDVYNSQKEPFIFIIDEWDCILREKEYKESDHKRYLDFIRNLLKDRAYVAMAYMTGILPIKKYGTHSALNMFTEYSMIDPGEFACYTGFTEDEVKVLCNTYHIDFDLVKHWYDGYVFSDNIHSYNPKSVVECILRNRFSSFWTQTETYEALKVYFTLNFDGLKDSLIRMLAGEHIVIDPRTFQNDMTTLANKDDVLTLLIHLGYLAYDQDCSSVFIPNHEISDEFVRSVKSCQWDQVVRAIEHSEKLLKATLAMDAQYVADKLDLIHQENTSILAYNDENSLSCVITLAYYYAQNEYTLVRELPSGNGFADIVFVPNKLSDKPAMIVELKYNHSAEGAIEQIKSKNYISALKNYSRDILLVGINYEKNSKCHSCVIEKYSLG